MLFQIKENHDIDRQNNGKKQNLIKLFREDFTIQQRTDLKKNCLVLNSHYNLWQITETENNTKYTLIYKYYNYSIYLKTNNYTYDPRKLVFN